MRSDKPPRLAAALLRCLAPAEEALAGDLQEEFPAGRSRGWYWRQVIGAIAIEAWRNLRDQKLVALGAVAMALVIYYALAFSVSEIGNDMNRVVTPHVPLWMLEYGVYQVITGVALTLVAYWTIGALIMGLSRHHGTVALLALLTFIVLFEFPRWTLLALFSMPEDQIARFVIIDTTMMMAKIAGIVMGGMAFPHHTQIVGERS